MTRLTLSRLSTDDEIVAQLHAAKYEKKLLNSLKRIQHALGQTVNRISINQFFL